MADGRKAEILYLNHVSQLGGAEVSLVSLLAHLDTSTYRPVVGLPGTGPLSDQLQALDVEVVLLQHPRLRRYRNPLRLLRQYAELRKGARRIADFVQASGIDLVHANSLSSAVAVAHSSTKNVPMIWHVRDLRLPRQLVRWLVPRTAALIAISAAVAGRVRELDPRAAAKLRVIYNGVDTQALSPRASRSKIIQELGLPPNARLIGSVGQLVPWKNWRRFLRVGADVAARIPNVHLLIIGADLFNDNPGYAQELKEYADDLAIGRLTHFLGHRTDIADVVSALDVLVHCADEEPLGRAVMEAMALERPVVAVRSGGPAELIVDGETGFLAPPKNAYALADRVVEILKNPTLAESLGKAARARIEMCFSPEQTARLVEQTYEDVLWQSGRPIGTGMNA